MNRAGGALDASKAPAHMGREQASTLGQIELHNWPSQPIIQPVVALMHPFLRSL